MKRDLNHFIDLENLIQIGYENFGNSVQVYHHQTGPLGYCYRYSDNGITIYTVVHRNTKFAHTNRRIIAHEYGHIILGHLAGVYEDLDSRVLWTIQNDRANLEEGLNKSLGIDYADKLLNRVLDDPSVNHSLHNIAMDFEVNSKILSKEDIEEMEDNLLEEIVEKSPDLLKLKNILETLKKKGENLTEEEKEQYKSLDETLKKEISRMKVKLMIPERYYFKDGTPFPNDLTYPEYLILIIKNLDQFVKMLISIKEGGSGDTSEVTEEDLKNSLNKDSEGEGGSGEKTLDDLLSSCGLDEGSGQGKGQSGERPADDHKSESRDNADKNRKEGNIVAKSPSKGCSSSGSVGETLEVNGPVDQIDMAIDEVIKKYKKKVCKFKLKKDMTYLYNRGINREIIAPVYHIKAQLEENPKIVFLIDVSGSMDRSLVSRILKTISIKMAGIKRGLKYDIITWSTDLGTHLRDIDPRNAPPNIRVGGGTRMARGIKYFRDNYENDCILVLISDFDDYLQEWDKETKTMSSYDIYGFNYGYDECNTTIKNMKVKNFNTNGRY